MKKSLFFLSFAVLVICSCGMINSNTPSNVAIKFAEALDRNDTTLAKTYMADPNTEAATGYLTILQMVSMAGRLTPGTKHNVLSEGNLDSSKVIVVLTPGSGGDDKTDIILTKVNGEWKVNMVATVTRMVAPGIINSEFNRLNSH